MKSVDDVKIEPQEYEKYLRRAYKEAKFPKPRNFIGMQKDLPVEEMEKLMLTNTEVSDDDLIQLANQRGQTVKDALTRGGEVAAGARVPDRAQARGGKGDAKAKAAAWTSRSSDGDAEAHARSPGPGAPMTLGCIRSPALSPYALSRTFPRLTTSRECRPGRPSAHIPPLAPGRRGYASRPRIPAGARSRQPPDDFARAAGT